MCCGIEVLLCCGCGYAVGKVGRWKARGAMIHNGKVVVDNQGRVMGRDGKLLKDKDGKYYFMGKEAKKNKKEQKDGPADSGETHSKNAKKSKDIRTTSPLRPNKRNSAPAGNASSDKAGQWSANEMAAWSSATQGNKENIKRR